ncbi:MAG: MarR family transcriptional regulator [Opitutae bacterium]|nr:MarR family transcriptional regulator [Opitutae bacterium]
MPHLMLKDLPRYECLLEAAREFPELDPTAAEAYLHLLRTADDVFALSESRLAAAGISQGRFGVLMLLSHCSGPRNGNASCATGPRTPAELADAAGVTRATMTGLIDTLERDGYVVREPDPSDRRMLLVRLTRKAENFLTRFLPIHFRGASEVMGALSDSERKTLVRLLGKIQHQLATLPPPAPTQKTA